jgi:hypothetical protein
MSKLCTYIVTCDTGQAPNPFGEWRTLAVCTPNHTHTSARNKGDWIAGFFGVTLGKDLAHKLVYAMELAENKIPMDDYFHDPRFQYKKPKEHGTHEERVGDNIYCLKDGKLQAAGYNPHEGNEEKDTKYGIVFVAKRFWYFGRNAVAVPEKFHDLIPDRQGTWVNHKPELVKEFKAWVEEFKPGRYAQPLHFEDDGCTVKRVCQKKRASLDESSVGQVCPRPTV